MSEKEKMLKGELYDPSDDELLLLRQKCHALCVEYNQTKEEETGKRQDILKKIGVKLAKNIYLQGPIYFDYGCYTSFGENSYANFNLTILDTCPVTIGKNVFIGTGVSLVTAIHPMKYKERNLFVNEKGRMTDKEYGKPITIKNNCWIASNVTICGGVTIGEGSVIGAGSVVTRDVPPNSFAAGVPCKVIHKIDY